MELFYPAPQNLPEGTRRSIRMDKKKPVLAIKVQQQPKKAEPRAYTHGAKTEAIITAISAGEFLSIDRIVEMTGAGKSTVEGVLSRADKRGQIEKTIVPGPGRARFKLYRMKSHAC